MEGLIPYLIQAMRKQKPHHHYRSMSVGSSRGYHLLMGQPQQEQSPSVEGSSHRRARSEFQPPTTIELFEQRPLSSSSGLDFRSPRSYNNSTTTNTAVANYPSMAAGSNMGSYAAHAHQQAAKVNHRVHVSDVRRR